MFDPTKPVQTRDGREDADAIAFHKRVACIRVELEEGRWDD